MESDPSTQKDLPKPQSSIPSPGETNKPPQMTSVPKAEASLSDIDTSLTTSAPVYIFAIVVVAVILIFSYVVIKNVSNSIESGDFVKKLDSYLFQSFLESPSTTDLSRVTNEEKAIERNSLGWSKLGVGNYAEAEEFFIEAINLDPHFALPYNNLGIVYHRQGDRDRAKEYYERSIEVDPTYVKPVFNTGQIYKELGEYASAVEYFTRAIEVDGSFAPSYEKIGEIYLMQSRVNKGLEAYREAIALGSEESARLNQILDNFAEDPDSIRRSFDIIPPDNMTFLGGSSNLKEARFVYHERVSPDSVADSADNPGYARTFYIDITSNDHVILRDHGELFGPQEKEGAPGYSYYGLPRNATIIIEEQKEIVINGLIAVYTRYSSPDDPVWYGEAVVVETDQYEYFIHNGGKRDDRFQEFYESFRYELGPERTIVGELVELQTVSLAHASELKLFSNKSIDDQTTDLEKVNGCTFPEIETVDLVLEYGDQWFEIKSFGVPKTREGNWQTISYPVDLGLTNDMHELILSPIIRMGENTFLIPNLSTLQTHPELVSDTSCYADFEYEVFYYDNGILKRDERYNDQRYDLRGLLFNRDKEIRPFCFNGCG